ncbi:MAG: hypothetical protein M1827_000600 [Pycnora praestabilis]|nr:MAG: hypothetical protein M1827_000600 [Pycnora praestabilis]
MDSSRATAEATQNRGQAAQMYPFSSRSRSNTSTSTSTRSARRPKSRASTTSVHSSNVRPSHQHAPDVSFDFQQQQTQQQEHHNPHQHSFQYSPEEGMILQSAQQLANPHGLILDPALEDHNNQGMAYPPEGMYGSHAAMADRQLGSYSAFESRDSQGPENEDLGQDTPEAGAIAKDGDKAQKKGSTSSIANDRELRRLYRENQHLSIKGAAIQVLQNESGTMAEKSKQIFAMLWLSTVCKKSQGSVPRSRVFSHYATRCGTERVPTLNPASFGKLVRVIFPGITTRRLGMRGESKYHYVDLCLEEDNQEVIDAERAQRAPPNRQQSLSAPSSTTLTFQLPADTAVFPAPDISFSKRRRQPSIAHRSGTSSSLFIESAAPSWDLGSSRSNMVRRELKFPSSNEALFRENEPIGLPNINQYTPVGTDPDNAAALTALYRSHCTSLIDCIRFCKEKSFFHHFTSFHGTLTVPVQKLLANPSLAPWIKECDWLMYQKMIRVVAPLTLQVVPKQVLDTLKVISETIGSHIKSTFQNHPAHVVEAKLDPATVFAALLNRLLRVNAAAHAAANMLCNDANRDQMWEDWILHVNPVKVVEGELPNCGYMKVLQILTSEIRGLLEPVNAPAYFEVPAIFANAAFSNNTEQQAHATVGTSTEGVLDRWTAFLAALPERFPEADARTLLHCIGAISTAALRDITMAQARSFGSWWITKVWVDEMVLWLAEKGGFMEHTASISSGADTALAFDAASEALGPGHRSGVSSQDSRFSSVDVDFSAEPSFQSTQNEDSQVGNRIDAASQAALAAATGFGHDQGHDDSGISMRLSDEDLAIGKYGGFVTEGQEGHGGSDGIGGDVVVC